jgi:hypothetical protein
LHDELPHSLLRMKEGVGHMIHYACPDEIVAAIQTLETSASPNAKATVSPPGSRAGNGAATQSSMPVQTKPSSESQRRLH